MFGSAVMRAAIAFGSNLLLVRLLMPEEFGRFAIALATIGVVNTLFSIRLSALIIRTPDADWGPETGARFRSYALWEAAFVTLIAGGWLAVSGLWNGWNILLTLTLSAALVANNHKALFERGQRYGPLAALEVTAQFGGHAVVVIAALMGLGEGALYLREALLVLVSLIGLRAFGALNLGRPLRHSRDELRHLARSIRGLWADGLLESLFARARVLAAAAVGGEEGAGFFAQAWRLATVPQEFMQPVFGRLAFNWFSRETDPKRRRAHRRKLVALATLPVTAAVIGAYFLADPIVPWVFGETWRPVVPLLISLSGVMAFSMLFHTHKFYLMAISRMRPLLFVRAFSFLGLGIPLAPLLWGETLELTTAGWAISLSFLMSFIGTSVAVSLADRALMPREKQTREIGS